MTTAVSRVAAAEARPLVLAQPEQAWGEKFFLAYSPFWMLGMG
jgi:hypothetical protein